MELTLFDKKIDKIEDIVLRTYNSYKPLTILLSAGETKSIKGTTQNERHIHYIICDKQEVGSGNLYHHKEKITLDGNDERRPEETIKRKSEELVNSLENFLGAEANISVSDDNGIEVKRPENTLPAKAYAYKKVVEDVMGLYKKYKNTKDEIKIEMKAEPEGDLLHITCGVYEANKKISNYEYKVKNNDKSALEKERVFGIVKEKIDNYFHTFPLRQRKPIIKKLGKSFEEFTYTDEGVKDNTSFVKIKPISQAVNLVLSMFNKAKEECS